MINDPQWALLPYLAGAWVFVSLAIEYWRALKPASSRVLGALALVCSASFLLQLIAWWTASPRLATFTPVISAFLAPLVLHTVGGARPLLIAAYLFHPTLALARWAEELGWLHVTWSFDAEKVQAAGWALTACAALLYTRRTAERLVLAAIVLFAVAGLLSDDLWYAVVPDYLLLAFFCVALYYRERLLFFDVFFRRSVYLAGGLALLALGQLWIPEGWAIAGGVLFWLAAPWAARQADALVEGRILRRRTAAAPDAEQRFLRDLQAASTEDGLLQRAEASLAELFASHAHLRAEPCPQAALTHPIHVEGELLRHACLDARLNGRPFFSSDHELLARLCRTLGIVWETLRVRERERELRLLASRAELKALRAQINPHFLFNSLNAIGGLIHSQPALADELVEKLADVFRYTLRQSEEEWVPFAREREFVEAYLAIEQGRFGDRLQVKQHTPETIDTCWLPAMMVQPLIENAIKHGAARHPAGGVLRWSAALHDAALLIHITDNGPAAPGDFTQEPAPGHALHNIRRRLAGYFGGRALLTAQRDGAETTVTLLIPQETRHARSDRG